MERLHAIGHPCASAFAYFHTLPLVTILSLLAALVTVTLFCGFCFTSPQHIALEYDWPLLSKFYRSSLFGRFPALKAFVRFTNSCVIILAVFGGGFFLLSSSLSGLLTLLLSFNMLLLFPEKRLPFPACFLFFAITCYIATAAHSLVPWSLPCNL